MADCGTMRKCDIIVLYRSEDKGLILEPTIRSEMECSQSEDENKEKDDIYNKTLNH